MRPCATLLVLSLARPAFVNVVCELACLQAHHHRRAVAVASQCHGHATVPAPVVVVSSVNTVLCHDDAPAPEAVVKAAPQFASMSPAFSAPRPPELRASLKVWRGRQWLDPPGLFPTTTQLRI
jgi:hypothetical protein